MEGINWQEWSDESFRRARESNQPVLLSISAVWCHWCHVMDGTTYSDPRVVSLINQSFVPIRVDNDKRPDINSRYNMGGWPSTVFLTPDADILTGATYLPPEQMLELMRRVVDVYSSDKEELESRAREMRSEMVQSRTVVAEGTALLTEGIISRVVRSVTGSYDSRNGGFGAQQKFPHTDALDLLLMEHHRTGDSDLLEMVTGTLDAMDRGDIHDKVAGGFFRYSTQSNWSIPHYEKMLQDNASLMSTYLSAYQETSNDRYLEVALDISRYLNDWLYDQDRGVFYGSQDADEDYYQLSREERSRSQAPRVDKTIYTNWNAMAARSYFRLYQVTLNTAYRDQALRCIDFLVNNLRQGRMFAHYYDGQSQQSGILNDQVHMLWTLAAACESTGDVSWLLKAIDLAEEIRKEFRDDGGGFYDITRERMEKEKLVYREKPLDDNSITARAFDRLSFFTHEAKWKRDAEDTLRSLIPVYENYGMMAAPYALAVLEVLEEPVRVNIAGDRDSLRTRSLLEQALRSKEPMKVVQVMDPESFKLEMDELGYEYDDEPRAYICHGTACQAAITDPDEIESAVAAAGGHPADMEE